MRKLLVGFLAWLRCHAREIILACSGMCMLVSSAMVLAYSYLPRDPVEPERITFGASIGYAFITMLLLLPLALISAATAAVAWRGTALGYRLLAIFPISVFSGIAAWEIVFHGM